MENLLTATDLFNIIISECENGCRDATSASDYFYKHYAGRFNSSEVFVLTKCIDYAAIRAFAPHIVMD